MLIKSIGQPLTLLIALQFPPSVHNRDGKGELVFTVFLGSFFFFLHGTFLEIGLFSSSIPSWRFRKTHSFAVCHLMSHFKHLEWCFDENHTTNPLPTHIVSVGHKLSRETAATWAIHRDLMIRRHLLLLLSPRASELTSGWTGEGAGTGSQTTHQAVPVPLMIIS